ncbi:class I SAM-dependent methyltransferase [Aquabacter sp. CN5-332]|uniref:class I SAM-dependent methyltransferase n=1 Tax=Aquabacter sp. CN5-332 TaxID=3156608 RepID=UPI0032B42F58
MNILDELQANSTHVSQLTIHGFSMVRNDADVMEVFVRQAAHLFDHFTFVDVSSTDGTQEILAKAKEEHKNITVLNCAVKEKYQAAMMNALARNALRAGVDWMFFLDADEFLPVESRQELDAYLSGFGGEILSMPWINLVPSSYSDFQSFDLGQDFRWNGRVSTFCKIAVSSLYFHNNPDAVIAEGNHTISPYRDAQPAAAILGMPLLHVPLRSRERLKYKMTNGLRFLRTKHNTGVGEGSHVVSILSLIENLDASAGYLNAIAADYGQSNASIEAVDPVALAWPTKILPAYLRIKSAVCGQEARTSGVTLAADAQVKWRNPGFVRNAPVGVAVEGDELRIVAQPISGRMQPRYEPFKSLPPVNNGIVPQLGSNSIPQLLSNTLATTLLPVNFAAFSAWSRLIPILFALFAIARPRRFVELGVHNGMSFFAGCQVAKHLQTGTDCIAVDSWVGDPHASFHDSSVFDEFKRNLVRDYPDAHFIQGMFSHARDCFEDESIDLLHIDGYHTYEAVKDDFDTWLSKMSDTGIIIFHDINVHERNFGVWQFWRELEKRYLGLSFMHSHGLGVLYVGRQENAISAIFRWMIDNPAYFAAAQKYFEVLGEVSIDSRLKTDEARRVQEAFEEKDRKIGEFAEYLAHRDETIRRLDEAVLGCDRTIRQIESQLPVPFNPELGERREQLVVIVKALRLLTRNIRIKQLFSWPFKSKRRRYRKQIKIAKFLRGALYGRPGG